MALVAPTHQEVDLAPDEDRVGAAGRVLRHREPAQRVARVVEVARLARLVDEAAARILRLFACTVILV